MTILGIESSCDETSAAILRDGELLSTVISSQQEHIDFGGIVPELASRAHLKSIVPIVQQALKEANVGIQDLDACAATQGPGLIGSLLVGLHTAKAIAIARKIPFFPIHHIEAHLFSTFIEKPSPTFPYLGLIVSGGHTQIMRVDDIGKYSVLGATIDDAAGEAFDKVAKMLGLGFPGGPIINKRANLGDPKAIAFPRPAMDKDDYNFSFSGLKTSVLYYLRKHPEVTVKDGKPVIPDTLLNDICASFQQAVIDVLVHKTLKAAQEQSIHDITVAGGVSANTELALQMRKKADELGLQVFIPKPLYSTDNAAMIAMFAHMKLQAGFKPDLQSPAFARSSVKARIHG